MEGKRVVETSVGAGGGGKKWLIPLGVIAALLAVYVVFCLWVVGNGKVMPNVSIAGLDVSGMTEEEASAALESAMDANGEKAVVVVEYGDWSDTVNWAQLNLADVCENYGQASAGDAVRVGREHLLLSGFHYLRHLLGAGTQVPINMGGQPLVDADGDKLLNIYAECVKAGNPDLPLIFTSTSKITFPGAGVAAQAASPNNVAMLKGRMKFQTIGPDKLNQLRHARMLRNLSDVKNHMERHAQILRPKFEAVLSELETQLGDKGIARWNNPKGGYFISLYVEKGCAKRVEELCANAGMILTPAGATYPYGIDPDDSNIRIAPSFPSVEEIQKASVVLCVAVKYAVLEKLLKN